MLNTLNTFHACRWRRFSSPLSDSPEYSEYLRARSQSNRKKHQQTGLFKQVEEAQPRAEASPQNYRERLEKTGGNPGLSSVKESGLSDWKMIFGCSLDVLEIPTVLLFFLHAMMSFLRANASQTSCGKHTKTKVDAQTSCRPCERWLRRLLTCTAVSSAAAANTPRLEPDKVSLISSMNSSAKP